MTKTAAIIGAQGYSGRELARLLLRHPQIQLTHVYTRNPEWHLSDEILDPQTEAVQHGLVDELTTTIPNVDIIFLATPHEVSLELARMLHKNVKCIIDLSGAFRLPAHTFDQWYEPPHSAQELLPLAQYGLCPWQQQAPTKIIANPGCYATAVLMALLPLAAEGLLTNDTIVIDAKSGISGAGRTAKTSLLFAEVANNFYPYKIGKHQHIPEIHHAVKEFSQTDVKLLLNTQVLPTVRGINATLYIPCKHNQVETVKRMTTAYTKAYAHYPLVRQAYLPSLSAKAQQQMLALKSVAGTCNTHIGYQLVEDHIVIFSIIDNLLKGAASQAIENANRLFGFPLEYGLYNVNNEVNI